MIWSLILWLLTIAVLVPVIIKKRRIEKGELEEYSIQREILVNDLRKLETELLNQKNEKQDLDYQLLVVAGNVERQKEKVEDLKQEEAKVS